MKEIKQFFERDWDRSDKVIWSLLAVTTGILFGIFFGPRKGDIRIGCDNDNHALDQASGNGGKKKKANK